MSDHHVHSCPQCYERIPCDDDCTIEPDMGTTKAGVPFGSHDVCAACEKDALTPSEIALAKVLAAWVEWPGIWGETGPGDDSMSTIARALYTDGLIEEGDRCAQLSERARALIDRARKAGVL